MPTYLRLLAYIKKYFLRLVVAIICIIMASGANLYVPWILKDVIDKVLVSKDMTMLNTIAAGIIVVFFFRGIFFFGQTYLMSYIGQKVIIDLREEMYRHLQRLSLSFYEQRQTGELMSYVTNDVSAVQSGIVDNMIELVTESSILIGSLVFMFYLDWKLSLLTLVTLPLIAHAIKVFGAKLHD